MTSRKKRQVQRNTAKRENLGLMLVIYLTGLLIGGLYVGMVSPARTVIQADFGIYGTLGIWMINIYTLFYAALIPIIGKIADRRGRKRVFTICMGVFCAGSIICGISQSFGGFGMLLVGRVVQAAGAGGVIPVANAEIGTTFHRISAAWLSGSPRLSSAFRMCSALLWEALLWGRSAFSNGP